MTWLLQFVSPFSSLRPLSDESKYKVETEVEDPVDSVSYRYGDKEGTFRSSPLLSKRECLDNVPDLLGSEHFSSLVQDRVSFICTV